MIMISSSLTSLKPTRGLRLNGVLIGSIMGNKLLSKVDG